MEIVMRDKRISQLSIELDQNSQMLNKLKVDVIAFEKQCSNLTKSLATSDRALRNQEQERNRLNRDLNSARDVCHSLDRSKDALQKQINNIQIQYSAQSHQIDKLQRNLDDSQALLQAQKVKCDRFEQLLTNERMKYMSTLNPSKDANSSNQELKNLMILVSEQKAAIEALNSKSEEDKISIRSSEDRIRHLEKLLVEQQQMEQPNIKVEGVKNFEENLENQIKETRREIEKNDEMLMGHSINDAVASPISSYVSSNDSIASPNINLEEDARLLEAHMQISTSYKDLNK